MKNKNNHLLIATLCTIISIGTVACGDDEHYDVYGDSYNRVYTESQSDSYEIVHTPGGTVSYMDFKWIAKCTRSAKGDIKVAIGIDDLQVAIYNKEHGTEYEALPIEAVTLENSTLTIPMGKRETIDTLHVRITNNQEVLTNLKSTKGYILPLRVMSVEGGDAAMSSNMNLPAFAIFSVTEKVINEKATEVDITGTLVADQSGWSVEVNSGSGNGLEKWFDGDDSTRGTLTDYSAYNGTFTVDMGQVYTFSAITAKNIIRAGRGEIGLSENGVDFKNIGSSPNGSPVIFYAPLKARYIRVSTGTSWLQGATFNIYAN